MLSMKIWFDHLSFAHSCDIGTDSNNRSDDCVDDCERECDAPFYDKNSIRRLYYDMQFPFPLDQQSVSHLAAHQFLLSSTLHIQSCDDSYWLICNPVEAGNIA